MTELQEGLVVATHGRHVWVETDAGARVLCHPRGKRSDAVVGDRVQWLASQDEGRIERVLTRRNLFFRRDEVRTKSFAANIDQILILIAAEPEFSEEQLARALIAAEAAGVPVRIALNKRDMKAPFARALGRLLPYQAMGYAIWELGLHNLNDKELADLRARFCAQTTLVLGPSGVGKSTLVNTLIPQAQAPTGEVSKALNSGKHTTTSTQWYWLDTQRSASLIDSPGFQEFGLGHLSAQDLGRWMPDVRAVASECRFYNCTHLHEPGCAVIAALGASEAGSLSPSRYRIYRHLHEELSRPRY